jgi:hypothetical protein
VYGAALTSPETKLVFAFEAKQQINPAIAESALTIENYYRVSGEIHGLIVSTFYPPATIP